MGNQPGSEGNPEGMGDPEEGASKHTQESVEHIEGPTDNTGTQHKGNLTIPPGTTSVESQHNVLSEEDIAGVPDDLHGSTSGAESGGANLKIVDSLSGARLAGPNNGCVDTIAGNLTAASGEVEGLMDEGQRLTDKDVNYVTSSDNNSKCAGNAVENEELLKRQEGELMSVQSGLSSNNNMELSTIGM